MSDVLGCPVTVLESLAEVHHGAFAGLTNREIEAAHPGELAVDQWKALYSWRFPDGESYADAERRATTAFDEIVANGATAPLRDPRISFACCCVSCSASRWMTHFAERCLMVPSWKSIPLQAGPL